MINLLDSVVNILGMDIALIDLIILGILVVLFIVGLCLGFLRQLANLFSPLLAAVVSYFTCKPLSNYLITLDKVQTTVSGWYSGLLEDFTATTIEDAVTQIQGSSIPSFLQNVLINLVNEQGSEILTNFRDTVMNFLVQYTVIAISFVLIFIVCLILFFILKKIFKAISKAKNAVSFIDKILGSVFLLLKGFILIYVICFLASFIPEFNDLLNANPEYGSITSKVMSWLTELLAKYFNFMGV